tara:strand:+ start:2984 stop:3565 length:582 start_codon:yes stop_codon:yes gene_type:complete
MLVNSVCVDNFYNDVDAVREMALSMEFGVTGNYPGNRTVPVYNEDVKNLINKIIRPYAGEITYWQSEYTGAFQYTTQRDRSWIHADQTTRWAAVLYLTPDAPLTGGTGLFRHKETGLEGAVRNADGSYNETVMNEIYKDSQDMTKWEMTDFVGNKYNRLIMYRGDNFHTSLDYFGRDINDGRLFQTFFFDTEY